MKNFIILGFALVSLTMCGFAQPQISGPLSGTLGQGTYLVVGNIEVANDDSLIIQSGTIFLFNGNYSFTVFGNLQAVGTELDSIIFELNTSIPIWGGIAFYDSTSNNSLMEYCIVTGSADNGIACIYSSPTISNCLVDDNYCGIYLSYSNSLIDYCTVNNNNRDNGGGFYIINSSQPIISNCTVSNNTAENAGGGIYCQDFSPYITNCSIYGNTAVCGGGIYCTSSSPAISNCSISGNTADYGGGIYCYYSNSSITDCSISGNNASYDGGGLFCYYGSNPAITNCSISGNIANDGGGGISCYYSNPVINICNISDNSTENGGGIFCNASNPSIGNCTISGNTANYLGGGIYGYYSNQAITNCVISGNTAYCGGGIHCAATSSPAINNCTINGNTVSEYASGIYCYYSSPVIMNTIVCGNLGNYGVYFENSPNTTINYSDFYNNQNGNFYIPPAGIGQIVTVNLNGDPCDQYHNIFLDPLFRSTTGDSAFYLLATSPCIDAGDPTGPYDPDNTISDMGAFYFDQTPPQIQDVLITISGEDVVLQWTPVTMALSYNIYRSDNPYFTISGMTPLANTTAASFMDTNAVAAGNWFYLVTYQY